MARTLLELLQDAADEVGIPQPASIFGNTDDQSRQLLALANREGKEFAQMANSRGGWQALHKEYVFQTNALPSTTGDIADGSYTITNIPDTTGIVADTWFVSSTYLPYQAKVVSVDSGTQVTLDRPASGTVTGATLIFGKGGYDLPSDLLYFALLTEWDSNQRWQLLGPLTAQEKQVLRYGAGAKGPRNRFYIRNNKMYLDPIPSTDDVVFAYDYYSNAWCQSAGGAAQTRWGADTDTYKLNEECFVLGMKWRFLRAKGFDYAQEKVDYDTECMRVLGRDGTSRPLSLNPQPIQRLVGTANVPDTGYGLPYNG